MAKPKLTRGERAIRWIETHCRVPEGKDIGKPIKLRPWQRKVVGGLYSSRTRMAIISFGRKNGKTALAAMLLLLNLVGPEAKANGQLYSAAQSREQAAILFALAAKIVRLSPTLHPFVAIRDTAKQLFCPQLGTLYRALSAEVKTSYGLSPVFIVHDELGQVRGPRSELYEALETATGAQEEPMSVVISTQAPTDADLLSMLIDDAATGADPTVKLFLYSAPDNLDPFSQKAMKAANPAFGDFLNAVQVKKQAEDARRMPSREASYRNLVLNQRVNQTSPFISRTVWASCHAAARDLTGREVYMGLDLSSRNDLTALVAIARDPDGVWDVIPYFFAPAVGLAERAARDRAPYDLWVRQGHLIATPGASVDYDWVATRLCEQCEEWDVKAIGFDRWRIDVLKAALQKMNRELPLVEHGQGFKDMSPALDTLESELLNKRLRHGGHPILTWCAANAVITKDPAGNRKLDKSKATGRIDGLVALAMALSRATLAIEADIPADYQMMAV